MFAREVEPLVKAKYPGIQRAQFNQVSQSDVILDPQWATCRCWGSSGQPCPWRRRRSMRGGWKSKELIKRSRDLTTRDKNFKVTGQDKTKMLLRSQAERNLRRGKTLTR